MQDDWKRYRSAAAAAVALGKLDVGQGAVAVGGRVVALEGPEGTDAMLDARCGTEDRGADIARRRGVLVKLCKPQQDLRADLPSIGAIDDARAPKPRDLPGIAVEAGRALVLERSADDSAADEAGIFVTGIDRAFLRGLR